MRQTFQISMIQQINLNLASVFAHNLPQRYLHMLRDRGAHTWLLSVV